MLCGYCRSHDEAGPSKKRSRLASDSSTAGDAEDSDNDVSAPSVSSISLQFPYAIIENDVNFGFSGVCDKIKNKNRLVILLKINRQLMNVLVVTVPFVLQSPILISMIEPLFHCVCFVLIT